MPAHDSDRDGATCRRGIMRTGLPAVALAAAIAVSSAGCRLLSNATSEQAAACRQLSQRGKSAMERGDARTAEALFAEAIKSYPEDPAARRHYADALWQRGAHRDALLQAEEALRLAGDDPAIAVQLGEMNLAVGRWDEAWQLANAALDADPRSAAAWTLRGRVAVQAGSLEDALADFHRALGFAPGDQQLLLETAEVHRSLGQPKQALSTLSVLSDTYAAHEEPARVLYLKGLALSSLGRHADAIDAYSMAIARQGANAELLARLADSQFRIGQFEAAEYAVTQALAIDPNHLAARTVWEQLSGHSMVRLPRE